jgi:hypothetical protein
MTMLGLKHKPETIEKMKLNHKGMLGKKQSEGFKKELSVRMLGNKINLGRVSKFRKTKKEKRDTDRNYYQKRRDWVDSLKNVPCKDCGNRFPSECMDFDHIRGIKEFEIHKNVMTNIDRLLKEISKCDIICANCHRIRTRKSDLLRKRRIG